MYYFQRGQIITDRMILIWLSGNVTGSHGCYTVNISNHNAERGLYITHIYAYDKNGNCLSCIGAYVNM